MNSSGDRENVPETNFDINAGNLEAYNEELNGLILWTEIEKAVCSLKNNTFGDLDIMLNEHIKNCYKVHTVQWMYGQNSVNAWCRSKRVVKSQKNLGGW